MVFDTTEKKLIGLLLSYLRPYTKRVLLALFFMLVASTMTALFAKLLEPILDQILQSHQKNKIIPISIAVFACFLTRGIATYLETNLMNKTSQNVVADIQKDLFHHFMYMDAAFFQKNPSGELVSRVISDVTVMRTAVVEAMTGLGKNLLTVIFLVGVMFYQDWMLSCAVLIIFPFAGLFVSKLGRKIRRISGAIQSSTADLITKLTQTFQGIRQVQAYGMESFEIERASNIITQVTNIMMKSIRTSTLSVPVNEGLVGLTVAGIIAYGGFQIAGGHLTSGELVSFIGAFSLAYEPMKRLAKLNTNFQMGLGATERVFAMFNTKATINSPENPIPFPKQAPLSLSFKNVTFRYDTDLPTTLDQISFTIEAGQHVALIGRSGSGKSTILSLIPRFYDVESGAIEIAGINITAMNLKDLRAHLSIVSQNITIFDDSVAANIAYGLEGATMAQIIEAAKAAAAHDFITALPNGYETRVGESGALLSGGQRQRLSIARAFIRNAPILLLDEATSALDNESEHLIQKSLNLLQKGRTTITVAHRLSTIRHADSIIVMDHGKIIETGTHDTLMQNEDGLYRKMVEHGIENL
jgi:subfamily B ATP-binding cassette protein MsbA